MAWEARTCYAYETEARIIVLVEFVDLDTGLCAAREEFAFDKGTTPAQAAVTVRERFADLAGDAKPTLMGLRITLP